MLIDVAQCDGYTAAGSPTGQQSPVEEQTDALILAQANPSWVIAGTDEERRSFEFFRSRTSLQLSGFFDAGFWTRVVIQAAHYEPAVRHAVLGLSSLHERFELGDKSIFTPKWDWSEGGFALQQYNQAIQQIIQPTHRSQQAVDICLIACMLFASFETLRGHHGSAMSHISAGVKILSEIHSNDGEGPSHGSLTISSRPFIELAHLEVLFNRLDSQVVQMIGTRPMTLGRICRDNAVGFCASIPTCFSTLEEARNSFDYHWNGCIQLFNDRHNVEFLSLGNTGICATDRDKYLDIFERWHSSFQAYLRKYGDTIDSKSWQGARVILIMYTFAYTNIQACLYLDLGQETIWDQFLPNYERLLALAEEVISHIKRETNLNSQSPPNFCLDMNFVAPLYAVAHKCRHPSVRRHAIALLYTLPRQEGIWDSILAARVAEKLISIEEEGLGPIISCEDVPDIARLNNVDVSFDRCGRLGTIKYSRIPVSASPTTLRRDYVETLEW